MEGIPSSVKVVRRNPEQDARTVAVIEGAIKRGDINQAMSMARDALDRGLVHPMLLNLRAGWLEQTGRHDAALEDLRTAFALAPTDVYVRNALGTMLVHRGERDEALTILQDTARDFPDFAATQYSLGMLFTLLDEREKAQEHLEKAVALVPEFPDALAQLAGLAVLRQDWAAVDSLGGRALALDPGHPSALTALARAALLQGHLEKSQNYVDRIGDPRRLPAVEGQLAQQIADDLVAARAAQG